MSIRNNRLKNSLIFVHYTLFCGKNQDIKKTETIKSFRLFFVGQQSLLIFDIHPTSFSIFPIIFIRIFNDIIIRSLW